MTRRVHFHDGNHFTLCGAGGFVGALVVGYRLTDVRDAVTCKRCKRRMEA